VNRDIYAEIYRTKLGHPWRRGRAWPMRKLEAGAGHRSRVQGREIKECKITLQNIRKTTVYNLGYAEIHLK
jgi:hypothetical protein